MLRSLHIENIAVVECADVEFTAGLNVLTGETGAGKSIVIDAIYAVSGARVGKDLVRTGAEKALASACFDPEDATAWCEDNGIDISDGELIIQRRISLDGKSDSRVNGVPVTAGQLKELGACLLDIHGQNDGRFLLDESRHRSYLDSFGDIDLTAYQKCYQEYQENEKEIKRLSMDDETRKHLAEILAARVEELGKAELVAGEEEKLEERSQLLHNGEKLQSSSEEAYMLLYGADASAVALAGSARGELERVKRFSEELMQADEDLKEAVALLSDASERIRDFADSLDFSPEEFDRVESRLSLLRKLEKKYNCVSSDDLMQLYEESAGKLSEISCSEDSLELLEKKRKLLLAKAREEAGKVTEKRRIAGKKLAAAVELELKELSMPSVRFETEIAECALNVYGGDEVRFLMSANAGETPGRISKIASGGELSRIMLAMKSVFGKNDPIPTAIFDEIDTGVSGVAASRVGDKLSDIGREKQVLCISHLPQIAAVADSQYRIYKEERKGRTYTTVEPLDDEGRIKEIARLIGGENITETTLQAARESLLSAQNHKRRGK